MKDRKPFRMEFEIGTIKHLGLQMYSTLPPVIGELISNAWDADAERVDVVIPKGHLTGESEITVTDNGCGMADRDIREAYLIVGRDRRKEDGDKPTRKHGRPLIGRKGIGKFSGFGIANEIDIETIQDRQRSRFVMNYDELEQNAASRGIELPLLQPTGKLKKGTRVVLRGIKKFRNRSIDEKAIRRAIARLFSVIGPKYSFEIFINGKKITLEERDLQRLLDKDADGKPYLWKYDNVEIMGGTGWTVSGWIGALDRTKELEDGIQRGIAIMARGKLVQAPFVFGATVGQQFALSYLVGELHAEFVDEVEDGIGTTRNSLVWDTDANIALKEWGQAQVNKIAREWAEKRQKDNQARLDKNPVYKKFVKRSVDFEDHKTWRFTDKFIRETLSKNPIADEKSFEPLVQMCLDFLEFDSFKELAENIMGAQLDDTNKIMQLFREWEIVEAKEMMRVTEGRIKTIKKLSTLIKKNALEVPTLHSFLKEFPWVLDPRWTLIADEVRFSKLLRKQFPEPRNVKEKDRRIDFLCVSESNNLVVVEIKRPHAKASTKELAQIEEYVNFMRNYVKKTTDPNFRYTEVVGYLLCGDVVDSGVLRERRSNLESSRIFVRRYSDLLRQVELNHKEFLSRYDHLRKLKKRAMVS